MTLRSVRVPLLFSILVVACRAGSPRASGTTTVPAWGIEQVADIAPTDDPLLRVVSLAADGDGNIYVADAGASAVRVFDSLGVPVRTVGRKGRGPGEFGELYSLAWAGDTLAALDPQNSRIELVSRSGEWVASWPAARRTGQGVRLYQSGSASFFMQGYRPAVKGTQRLFLRAGPATPADTIVPPPDPPKAPSATGVRCEAKERVDRFGTPWDSRVIDAVSPDGGLVRVRSDDYRIIFFDRTGTPQRVTMYGAVPVPVADAEWDSVLTEYEAWRAKVKPVGCEPASLPRPPARPALRAIEFDDRGRMWTEAAVPGGFNFHVFDSAGGMLANMPAPARDPSVPFVVRRDRIYLVGLTEGGEQAVRAYRLSTGK